MSKREDARKVRQAVNRLIRKDIDTFRQNALASMNAMPWRLKVSFCWQLLRSRLNPADWMLRFTP
jgi:hypothetical protein